MIAKQQKKSNNIFNMFKLFSYKMLDEFLSNCLKQFHLISIRRKLVAANIGAIIVGIIALIVIIAVIIFLIEILAPIFIGLIIVAIIIGVGLWIYGKMKSS